MAQIIGLPKLSPTMEEGVLVKWHKKEGDSVEPGDLVAEVETDKANMDFNLEDEGVLLKLLVAEGDTVKLGAPVAILGEAGEDVASLIAEASAQSSAAAAPAPAQPSSSASTFTTVSEAPPPAPPKASAAPTPSAAPAPSGGRLLASPLAKTLAIELGVDLRQVQGSGPGGRIVERDVRAMAGASAASPAPAAHSPAPAPMPAEPLDAGSSTALAVYEGAPSGALARQFSDEYEDRPLSGVRKTIAQRLTAAKQQIPHYRLNTDFDAGPLRAFRRRLNELLGDRGKVTINDMLIKGCALALRRVPDVNAAFMGDAIRYYSRVHMGVAVALDRGLLTPVVRNADLKGIGVIGAEVKDLVHRAKERQLKAHEIQGSTFTISNLGMFGINHFDAIINPPEAAILAVGRIREVPMVKEDKLVVEQRMALTMSCDHRVIDGALGARFLDTLVELLEAPETLAL
jgi:pyruvate dehydrogenase E2 component (dihydrolipoamide acetyltransferase)